MTKGAIFSRKLNQVEHSSSTGNEIANEQQNAFQQNFEYGRDNNTQIFPTSLYSY